MRQQPSYFDEHEPRLIYIAKTLKESLAVEILLSEKGVEYGVETDQYRGGFIFQTERTGAFFYVRPDVEEDSRRVLAENGYHPAERTPTEAPAS